MAEDNGGIKAELKIALDLLKKQWGLKTRAEVLERLLNEKDPTLLQIAQRRVKLKKNPPEA